MSDQFARLRRFLSTSYGVMAVVIAMYLVKVVAKVGFGSSMHSPMVEGDGWHNGSDIFQALAVIAGVYLARRPPSKEYPFGWVSLDALVALAIAFALAIAAFANVLVPSLTGILTTAFPDGGSWWGVPRGFQASRLSAGPNVLAAVLIMFASAGVSVAVSRYQVRVGTATGHASVVADGEETMSDGKIEALAAAGLVVQFATGLAWLEYLFGLAMAAIMLKTAYEIFENGRDMLFNRSLGVLVDSGIRSAATSTPGVHTTLSVLAYRRGACRVADVEVMTFLGSKARAHIERHLAAQIRAILSEEGGEGVETAVTVRAVPPEVEETRWGYLARIEDGVLRVVGSPDAATHLVVCEVTNGVIMSCRDVPVTPASLADVVASKRVTLLRVFGDAREVANRYPACLYASGYRYPGIFETAAAFERRDPAAYARRHLDPTVRVEQVPTSDPRLLGIPLG